MKTYKFYRKMNIFECTDAADFYHPDFVQEGNSTFSWEAPFLFESLPEEGDCQEIKFQFEKMEDYSEVSSTQLPFTKSSSIPMFHDLVNTDNKNLCNSQNNSAQQPLQTEKKIKKEIANSTEPSSANLKKDLGVDTSKDYSSVVKDVLRKSGQIGSELSFRRDVANKYVLRSFRKTISKLFKTKVKRPSRSTRPFELIKKQLLQEAVELGIIIPAFENNQALEFKELVCWMAISKMTHLAKPLFDYSNESIKLISDLLNNYSHAKLRKIYANRNLGQIYKYFMDHCLEESFAKLPEDKRIIYTKAAEDILSNFN